MGDGPGRETLRAGGSNLVWLGLVDDRVYGALVHDAIAGLITLLPGVSNSVVPSKLVGYLAAGIPVIVAAGGMSEAVRVVTAEGCGIPVPPGRPDALADAIMELVGDKERRERLGAKGKAFVEQHWAKATIVDRIERALLKTADSVAMKNDRVRS